MSRGASIISDDISFISSSNIQKSSIQLLRRSFLMPWKPDKFVKDAGSREIEFSAILPALQFPQKTEISRYDDECLSCMNLYKCGDKRDFPFWSVSFRQSHIKQSGCLMDSFKQKYPLL